MMKHALSCLSILWFSISWVHAQEKIEFHLTYLPSHVYHQQFNQSLNYELSYSGSQEFMDQLKKNHISNPTKTSNQTTIETRLKSGKVDGNNLYPLQITMIKGPVKNNQPILPNGSFIYGHGRTDGALFVDSLDENITQTNDRSSLLQIVQGIFSQLYIPKHTLQVGDTFSVVSPVAIPIGNLKFDLKLTTHYKMISFDGKKAVLQIRQTYAIQSKVKGYAVTASGNGNGTMEYLPASNFFSRYQVQTNLQMNIKSNKMNLQLNSNNTMEQNCVVESLE